MLGHAADRRGKPWVEWRIRLARRGDLQEFKIVPSCRAGRGVRDPAILKIGRIFPGRHDGPGGGGVRPLLEDQDFLGWLGRVHATTRFTTSVCTGSLLLAAAGLLDGLTAATHWGAAGEIEGYGATYTPERVVRHGRIITSAGVSSGIDMALRLAALLADETTAQAIQLYTEYDPQPPFDSGSIAKASPEVPQRARALG